MCDTGRAEDTIAGHLDHIKAMLNWAVDQKHIGTVSIAAEGCRMKRWFKSAKPVWSDNDELLAWEPHA